MGKCLSCEKPVSTAVSLGRIFQLLFFNFTCISSHPKPGSGSTTQQYVSGDKVRTRRHRWSIRLIILGHIMSENRVVLWTAVECNLQAV
jgi:hypothetical protein